MNSVRIPVPESGVLRACLDLLTAERVWHERRNTLPVWVKAKAGNMRPLKVAEPGTADIFATPIISAHSHAWPQPLWIETKSDIGLQRQNQKDFQAVVEAAGHVYLLVRDPDVLKRWLIEHGAMRNK